MPTTMERLQVEVTADVSRGVADLHRFESEVRRTQAIIAGLGGSVGGMDTRAMMADMRRLEAEARRMAGIVGGIGRGTAGMGVSSRVTNTWNTYNNQVSRTHDNMKRLVGLTAGAVGGAGIGRLFVGGIKKAMDFDTTMRMVGVQTGQTGAELKSLGDTALKMGADTIYSASEAGQAMLELAKGGLTAAQIKGGALQESLTLAAAGGLELADSASAVVNGMGAFGLKAGDASRVTTALAGAANASSADVSDLTQSLQQASAQANATGMSIEVTSAALAIFANNGVKGSDAGTSFKTMVASLTPTTDKAKKAMKRYGLEFTTQDGKFKSLADVAGTLSKGLGGLSEVQRQVALETIFGSDASRAAKFIMDAGRKGVDKFTKSTSDQRSAQDLANVAMSGASGAWNNFTGAVETGVITLGQKALPAVTDLLTAGTDLVSDAGSWGPKFQEYFGWMGDAATDLYAAVKPLGGVIESTVKFIDGLPGPVKEMGVQAAIAALVLPRLSAGLASAGTSFMVATTRAIGFGAALRSTGTAAQTAAIGKLGNAAKTAAGIGGMVALTQAMGMADKKTAALTGALGGAALGFSVAGPWGAAIGGGIGLLVGLKGASGQAAKAQEELAAAQKRVTDTLNAQTGNYTKRTKEMLVDDLATKGMIGKAKELKLNLADMTDAVLQGGGALADFRVKAAASVPQNMHQQLYDLIDSLGGVSEAYSSGQKGFLLNAEALGKTNAAAAEATVFMTSLRQEAGLLPKEAKIIVKADDQGHTLTYLQRLATQMKLTPKQVTTVLALIRDRRNDAEVAITKSSLASIPKWIRPRIKAMGGTATRTEIRDIAIAAGSADGKKIRTIFQAVGVKPTKADMAAIRSELDATGKKPANLSKWKGGLESGVKSGKHTAKGGSADVAQLLAGAGKNSKPNLSPFLGALTSGVASGRHTASAGASGIGSDMKWGFQSGFGGAGGLWSGEVRSAVNQAIAAGRAAADAHSPSRKTARLGRDMADGLSVGMKKKGKEVRAAAQALIGQSVQAFKDGEYQARTYLKSVSRWAGKSLNAHTRASIVGLVARDNKRLGALYDRRKMLESRYASASASLAAKREVKATFVQSARDGMAGQANVLNAGNNAATIKSSLQAQVAKVKKFASYLLRLRKLGYRSDIIAQVAGAGVEGGMEAARALVAASKSERASINSSYASINGTASYTAKSLGSSLYQSGIRAAEGLVAGLKKKKSAVEAALIDMAVAMQKAIKKALGIHSPSRVMASLGGHTGQGLADGILGKESTVADASRRLAYAAVVAPPRLTVADTHAATPRGPVGGPAAVMSGAAVTNVFQFTTNNPVAEPQSRTTNKALDKASALGLV